MPKERIRVADLEIQDAHIFARNFKGEEKKKNGKVVNSTGTRTFCVEIPDTAMAQEMKDDGWNVSMRIDSDTKEMFCYLPVEVRFSPVHPDIFSIVGGEKHQIEEDQIHQFDQRKFRKIDLVIHPSWWYNDASDEWRIKAFLSEGWFYIQQSRFAEAWDRSEAEE